MSHQSRLLANNDDNETIPGDVNKLAVLELSTSHGLKWGPLPSKLGRWYRTAYQEENRKVRRIGVAEQPLFDQGKACWPWSHGLRPKEL